MIQRMPPPLTSDVALFLDFDGTLVEIAPTPSTIKAGGVLSVMLRRATLMLHGALAIVSGRSISAIDQLLPNTVVAVAGVHGAELRNSRGQFTFVKVDSSVMHKIRALLTDFNNEHPEVLLEDKGLSLALHFRNAPHLSEECRTVINRCVREAHGQMERLDGAFVCEIKPANVSKATAIESFMKHAPFQGRRPIFAGDDITDESGFGYVASLNGFGIIVGDRSSPTATRRLPSVAALHHWLQTFVACEQHD